MIKSITIKCIRCAAMARRDRLIDYLLAIAIGLGLSVALAFGLRVL